MKPRKKIWHHAAKDGFNDLSVQEAGVQAPLGFWDPLGLSTSGNVSDYKRRREVELKHGTWIFFMFFFSDMC